VLDDSTNDKLKFVGLYKRLTNVAESERRSETKV
jgi:hypothetical protein